MGVYGFLVALILAVCMLMGHGQDQFIHPLTNMAPAHPEITTSYLFPDHPDKLLPLGELVTVLCQVQNLGDSAFNISAIMGSLNTPNDFGMYIQNFSYIPFGSVIRAGEEITLDYRFYIAPQLMPEEYTIATTVFYQDGKQAYSNTFFNETIETYSMEDGTDLWSLLSLAFALTLTAITITSLWFICGPTGKDARKFESDVSKFFGAVSPTKFPQSKSKISVKDVSADEWLS